MTAVKLFNDEIEKLGDSAEIAESLGEAARSLAARVRAPRHLRIFTRRGTGPRGAFSQVIMSGQGALSIEYGNSRQRALSPLRSALRGMR